MNFSPLAMLVASSACPGGIFASDFARGGIDPGSRLYRTRRGWRDDARRRRAKDLAKRRRNRA